MSFFRIRGDQLKSNIVSDHHIKTRLTENVLDISWKDHATEILEQKLIIDYVQKDTISVPSNSSNITIELPVPDSSNNTMKGIVLNYKVKIRRSNTGEPISYNNYEVYGKLSDYSFNSGRHEYTLSFYYYDTTEKVYTIQDTINIDILYPRVFSLADIPIGFLENERFIDGAIDVTTYLNLLQIARDTYGSQYNYNENGLATNPFNNGNSLIAELIARTQGIVNISIKANSIIDEVISARGIKSTLGDRLSVSINPDGTLKIDSDSHKHIKQTIFITENVTDIDFVFEGTNELNTPKLTDEYIVYVNGLRSLETGARMEHYIHIDAPNVVTVSFVSEVEAGDVIVLEATIFGS